MPTRLHKLTPLEESDDIFGLQPEGILASAASRPRPSPATEVQPCVLDIAIAMLGYGMAMAGAADWPRLATAWPQPGAA